MKAEVRPSSYYNQVELTNGTSVLFNGRTLCMDIVPADYAKKIEKGSVSFLTHEEREHLLNRGHITSFSPERELEEFKKLVRIIFRRTNLLNKTKELKRNLSFILTYNCNLSCNYCYQRKLPNELRSCSMTSEFAEEILKYAFSKLFPQAPKKHATFLLFGGEPLLPCNRDTILKILEYAKKWNISCVSTATNAVHVPDMIDLIGCEPGKIQSVQITLDGDQAYHDENRIPSSKQPTFDNMIAAISKLKSSGAYVCIRVHTHPSEFESTKKLVDYLENENILGDNVDIYFAPLNDFQNISSEDYAAFSELFHRITAMKGRPPTLNLDFLNNILQTQKKMILPKVRFCSLGFGNAWVIDPMGDIYDCFEQAGYKDQRVGIFSERKVKFLPMMKEHYRRYILNIPECLKCSMALFCGGGCPNQANLQNGSMFKPNCLQNKEYIFETLKAFVLLGVKEAHEMEKKRIPC